MRKIILGFVVFVLSFGLCFAKSSDFDDEFENDFEDGVEFADEDTEYEIIDGIEEVRSPIKSSSNNKKSRVVSADREKDFLDGIEDDDDPLDDIDVTGLVYTPQTTGVSIGCYFSALEIKPTFSFIHDTFEMELSCNIVSFGTMYGDLVGGVGPGLAVGFNSNPFERGIQNCFGVSYIWYPIMNTHIGSLYYRFGVRSRFGSGFITEVKLPVVAYLLGDEFVTIANVNAIPFGLLYSALTFSMGYKFYF